MRVPEQFKAADFWIERVGLPLLFCGFLAWLLVTKMDRLEKRMVKCSRNQFAMMRKLHIDIPPVADDER